jgi:limonene-1,2-epoxide hydrolase
MTVPNAHTSLAVIERLHQAMNRHDLDALVDCFDAEYRSEQPLHPELPELSFQGRDRVQANWTGIWQEVPDFQAERLRSAIDGEAVWTEWRWHGHRADGTPWETRGVTLFEISTGRIVWGRLYLDRVRAVLPEASGSSG